MLKNVSFLCQKGPFWVPPFGKGGLAALNNPYLHAFNYNGLYHLMQGIFATTGGESNKLDSGLHRMWVLPVGANSFAQRRLYNPIHKKETPSIYEAPKCE